MSNYPTEFAKHFIGVGGILIHNEKVLLVKLNYGMAQKYWLIPGGFIDQGETLEEAVIRELFEETGMRVESQGILGVRTMVRKKDNITDLYCVLKCKLLSNPEPVIPQVSEIAQASWLPIEECLSNPEVLDYTKLIIKKALQKRPMELDRPLNTERKNRLDLSKYEQFWIA